MKWEWLEPRKKDQTALSILSRSLEALSFCSPSPCDIHTHLKSGLQRHALGRWSPLQSGWPIKQDPKACRFSLSTNTLTRKRKRVRRGEDWRRKKAMQQYLIASREEEPTPHLEYSCPKVFGHVRRMTYITLCACTRCASSLSNEARRPRHGRVCREPRELEIQAGTRVVSSFHALEAFYAALMPRWEPREQRTGMPVC